MKMNKRLLSMILVVVMVLGMIPLNAIATDEKEIQIHKGNDIVSDVEFPVNGSVSLSARASLDTQTVSDFQWQIQVPGTDTWVAIYGETNADISVANAMIANMTDGAGKAYLRCRGIIAGEEVFSEDVSVKAAEAVHSEVEVPAYVPAAAPISESEKAADAAWEEADAKQTAADAAYDEAEAAKKAAEAAAVAVSEAEAAAAAAAEAVVTAEAAAAEKLAAADSAKAAYDAAPDETTEAAWTAAAAEAEAATTAAVEAKAAAETAAANAAAAAEAKTAAETAAAEAEVKYMAAQAEADAAIEKAAQLTDLTGAGMAAFGGRAIAETYEIRIDYIFADGTTAAESFVRHITAGTDYVLNVPSPIISGYTADRLQVEENITGISENKIFKVTYTTNIVEFNVRHMWEKVDGGYEVHETTTHSGPAFGPIGDGLAKNTYTGFAAVVYDASQFIKHDGTTVVDIHYDRLFYMMNFDLSGGYGVEPIYARYGTTVPALNTPLRAGYTFDGWNPALPSTVPAEDTSYTAKWKSATQVNVNLVFWYENANDANYSYVGSTNTTAPFTPGAKVTPSQFKDVSFTGRDNYHFTFNNNKNEAVALNADGTTIVNVYFKRNTYRLIFFNCRICATNKDTDSCYPTNRAAGLKFVNDKKITDCVEKMYDNDSQKWWISIYTRKWQQNVSDLWHNGIAGSHNQRRWKPYQVSGADGKQIYNGTLNVSMMHVMPDADIVFRFLNEGETLCNMNYWVTPVAGQTPTGDTKDDNGIRYIKWDSFSTYMGGITENEEYVDIEGFTKVYTWDQLYNKGYRTKGDGTATAHFFYRRNSYNLAFINNGVTVRNVQIDYEGLLNGTKKDNRNYIPPYPSNLEPNAYEFKGWYLSQNCSPGTEVNWDTAKMPVGGMSVYARWVPVTHTVTTSNDEGAAVSGTYTATHNTLVSNPPANPTKEGFTFVSWFYRDAQGNEVPFNFDMIVTKDLTLYAKWREGDTTEGNYATVTIGHYLQDLDNEETYTPKHPVEINAYWIVGNTYSEEEKNYEGFTLNEVMSTANGTTFADGKLSGVLTKDGLELKLYYDRNSYPYEFRFLEEGTNKVLHDPVTGTAKYEDTVSQTAKIFAGYELIGDENRSIQIGVENNVVTFYYKPMYTTLTITKSGANTTIDPNQSFVFNISGDPYDDAIADIDMDIVITGNGTKTIEYLPVGNYTVKEITDWSWRYDPATDAVRIAATNPDDTYNASFSNTRTENKWLDGDSVCVNWFNGSNFVAK